MFPLRVLIVKTVDKSRLCSVLIQSCSFSTSRLFQSDTSPINPDESFITLKQRPPLPLMTSRQLAYPNKYRPGQQVWLETLSTTSDEKLGLIDLHPEIFASFPRLDLIHSNVRWQQMYKKISYEFAPTRAEMRGGGRKPWPQKGTGRARHGSIRSPIWLKGGRAHGPRGPESFYYMLNDSDRVWGLRSTLTVKFAQNDLHIVDSLDIPTDDPEYIEDLFASRFWGFSALFVDDTDIMPRNISLALNKIKHFNLMPVYGLNVYSMLKHETLVLTLAAVEKIEKKLLYQMHKTELHKKAVHGYW